VRTSFWPGSNVVSRRLLPGLAAACLFAGVIAGCGSSSTTPKPASGKPAAHTGEASKPPAQILADAAAALRKAGSYRMQARMTQLTRQRQHIRMSVDVFSAQTLSVSMTFNGLSFKLISVANKAYMEAGQKFWDKETHNSAAAALLAGRWLVGPTRSFGSLASVAGEMSPSRLAGCMIKQHGHLSIAGYTTVDHRPAVVLHDAGNGAGNQRGTLAIATTGVPYPLQVTASGKQQPGGAKGPCGSSGSGPSSVGTITLSGFGHLGKLRLPAHPINLNSLGGSGELGASPPTI
jgi:hypothetical protein